MNPPHESPFVHECVLASAGSGKTFRLASRYLALLRAGAAVESILATTFTRAAAGEIERRILLWLVSAASDPAVRAELVHHTGGGAMDRDDVIVLLRRIVQDLDRLQVRTIDSFFGGIISGFGLELGLAPGIGLADATAEAGVRREAIETLLRVVGDDLLPILRKMSEGATDRQVYATIDLAIDRLDELAREAPPEAWAVVTVPEMPADREERLLQFVAFEPEPKSFKTAHTKAVEGVRDGRLDVIVDGGLGAAVLAGKVKFRTTEIDDVVRTIYERAIEVLRVEAATSWQQRAEGIADMLALYGRCLEAVKRKRRVMTFSDVPRLLVQADIAGRLQEVRYRLDGAIDHLELDEFQDTSPIQWQLLRPMAEELIVAEDARETSFFCVGDVKQSIYGWRSACPEILESVPSLLTEAGAGDGPVKRITMDHSYRSAPPVIAAVNRVFETIADNPALKKEPTAAAAWGATFGTHTTERLDDPGRVELRMIPGEGGSFVRERAREPGMRRRITAAAELVATLLEQAPGLSIGVLARTNKTVGKLLHAMGPSELDLPVSGRGGTLLTDTPAVNAILALLQLAVHPGDSAAAFHVAHSPLGVAIEFMEWNEATARSALARQVRRDFQNAGPVATVQRWVHAVAAQVDPRSWHRLGQLVDLAAEAEAQAIGAADPGSLLQRVESQRAAEPRPAPIQIMNVHQSKGLEFDAVVLADLDVGLVGQLSAMTERVGNVGSICRLAPPASAERIALLPELQSLYHSERNRRIRESLCGLYVAMTRARYGLYLLIDPLAAKPGFNLAAILGSALSPGATAAESPDGLLYAEGDPEWMTRFTAPPVAPPEAISTTFIAPPLPSGPPSGLGPVRSRRQRPASALSAVRQPLAYRLQIGSSRSRMIGTAAHAILEKIVWLDDGDRAAAPAGDLQRGWIRAAAPRLDAEGENEVLSMVAAALDQPDFRQLFRSESARLEGESTDRSQGSAAGAAAGATIGPAAGPTTGPGSPRTTPQVYGEWAYVAVDDAGVSTGSIDRLVVHGPPDAPERAEVIDFKTDMVTAEETGGAAEHHRPQLERYRDEVARQFDLPRAAVHMKVAFVRSGVVVSLESD